MEMRERPGRRRARSNARAGRTNFFRFMTDFYRRPMAVLAAAVVKARMVVPSRLRKDFRSHPRAGRRGRRGWRTRGIEEPPRRVIQPGHEGGTVPLVVIPRTPENQFPPSLTSSKSRYSSRLEIYPLVLISLIPVSYMVCARWCYRALISSAATSNNRATPR